MHLQRKHDTLSLINKASRLGYWFSSQMVFGKKRRLVAPDYNQNLAKSCLYGQRFKIYPIFMWIKFMAIAQAEMQRKTCFYADFCELFTKFCLSNKC